MNESSLNLKLSINLMAGVAGVIVAITVPLIYFALGWQTQAGSLSAEASYYAGMAAKVMRSGSGVAHAGDLDRLETFFVRQPKSGEVEQQRITDARNRIVVESGGSLEEPAIVQTAAIVDSDQVLGYFEVGRSVRPLLWNTGLMAFPGALLGWLVFVAVRIYPLRTLRLALQEIAARKQTEARLQDFVSLLSTTLESTADGILVVDGVGRTVVYNHRYAEMWGIPREVVASHDDNTALAIVVGQLVEPTLFLKRLRTFSAKPAATDEHHEILELNDGRVFEWYSQAQWVDGVSAGRVSSFHDISERKRAEALLAGEKRVLEMIVSGASLHEALSVLARNVEAQSGKMICAILFHETQEENRLRVAAPSMPEAYRQGLDGDMVAPLSGLFGSFSQGGDPLSVIEIADDVRWREYQELVHGWGLKAKWVAPIFASTGKLLGAIIAHYRGLVVPGPNDLELLGLADNFTGIAVERKHAETRMNYLAHYDPLTGLPNRALFRDRLTHALARAERSRQLVALMFLDLDRFKAINDTLGHDMGDLLLKTVAERLRRCIREEDTVARLGGDEFTVILESVEKPEDAALVAQKIIDAFAVPVMLGDHETFISSSIGITISPLDSGDLDELLKNADAAMYRAKERGRNNYQFYMVEMNARSLDHLRMETGLRHALERNEFLMYYQPKIDLHSGAIVGMEALLRWNHPERGIVSPLEFIPLLEETGLITPVGEWLMRAACLQNKAWCDLGFPPLHMAVNLSARQFQGNDLAQNVATVLAETGLDPELLELEVTESMLMDDPESTVDILQQIKAMGVLRINLDDFGTGYSSLSYLKRFPVSAVKLDRSFVSGLPDDEEDVAIAVAVIAMAHSLKLKVIAEGVETTRQLDFLRQHQCDEIQGFICSEPVSAEEFLLLLQQNQGKGWLPEAAKVAPIRLGRKLYKDSGRTNS